MLRAGMMALRTAALVTICGLPAAGDPIEIGEQTGGTTDLFRTVSPRQAERGGVDGAWSASFTWGLPGQTMVPIHATLVPVYDAVNDEYRGQVFTWGYYGDPDFYLWNPAGGQFNNLSDIYPLPVQRECSFSTPVCNADLFCSGHSVLPDGQVLITGGNLQAADLECPDAGLGDHGHGSFAFAGLRYAHVFNPNAATPAAQFIRQPDMRDGRWYPSNLALADGRVLVVSGLGECSYCDAGHTGPVTYTNADLEIFTPGVSGPGTWQLAGQRELPLYPFLHVLRNGQVFYAGPGSDARLYNPPPGSGTWQFVDNSAYPYRGGGSFVGVPGFPDSVMIIGGGCCGPLSSNTVEQITIAGGGPQWQTMAPLNEGREYLDATILPDRTIFVSGGRRNTWDNVIGDAVYLSEMYDPHDPDGTPNWRPMALAAKPRMYHSTALLLPDGSVWTGGGTGEGPHGDQPNAEIFYPPYYFASNRPGITRAPQRIYYGKAFSIGTTSASGIGSAVLVRPGSATHAVNMEQRLVDLSYSAGPSGALTLTAPPSGNHAPPGFYMLFVADSNRVPSVARIVQLVSEDCPACRGDANCDGSIDFFDIDAFLLALFDSAAYRSAYPACRRSNADVNLDGSIDFFDIDPFLACLFSACP